MGYHKLIVFFFIFLNTSSFVYAEFLGISKDELLRGQSHFKDFKPESSLTAPKESVDLREYMPHDALYQVSKRCTAYATTAALELGACMKGSCDKLSEAHAWSLYRQYNILDALKAVKKESVLEADYWPHTSVYPLEDLNSVKGKVKLVKFSYLGRDSYLIRQKLSEGKPVVVAMRTPVSMLRCATHISGKEYLKTGHALLVMGYTTHTRSKHSKMETTLILRNSFGPNCHDKGYAYMDLSQCSTSKWCHFFSMDEVAVSEDSPL